MTISQDKLPAPYDLMPAPQLAIISVLQRTLEMLVLTLLAQHPDLVDHEKPYWLRDDLSVGRAEEVLSNIDELCTSLEEYRDSLSDEIVPDPLPDDTFPF